jgi:cell division protein FtsI (penicillin-binding protein 3)
MIGRQPLFPRRKRGEAPASPAVETGRNRLLIMGALFAVAFSVVSIRLVDVTIFGTGDGARSTQTARDPVHKTGRANIVDRNGALLATNLETASLHANPRKLMDARDAATRLARALPGLDRKKAFARLTSDREFVWIKRHLTPRQKHAVNRLGIPSLDFRNEERRVYPSGSLAAHVLGFTDVDNKGLAGVERYFDQRLKRSQEPLQLSLDLRVQYVLRQELERSMQEFRAIGATGVVMDVRTGEILGMVSLPDFDPNENKGVSNEKRFNRASLGVYEMGSGFKIFTAAMALDYGTVSMSGGYDATNPIRVSRFTIRDFHGKRRWLSVPEIFKYSSNIGSVKMALDVGTRRQKAFLRKIGLFNPPPLETTEIGAPLLPRKWREVNTMTIAFGHGISISAVQMVAAASAMVNGGIMNPPTLIKRVEGSPSVGKRVISRITSDQIRRLMRLVVVDGTGKNAAAPGFLVGGKTGTANKVSARGYRKKAVLSTFIGAFPMNAPRYMVFALLDEPIGTKKTYGFATGGWVAAPVVGRVISRIGPMLGMAPVDEDAPEIRRRLAIDVVTRNRGKRRLASY